MEYFLLPFREGAGALRRFSSAGILISAIGVGVIAAIQTEIQSILTILVLVVIGASIARTRWRVVLSLAGKFEVLILFWIFLMPFMYGETILLSVQLPWRSLPFYLEGLQFGVLIGFRMMTMVILFIAALSHMTLSEFIGALRTIRVPVTILGSLLIMLRYIPLFIGERKRMQEAQSLRGYDYGTRFERIKSLGYLIGSTIDRAFDRSITVYEAMTLRGFGKGMVIQASRLKRGDFLLFVLLFLLLLFTTFFLQSLLMVVFQ